MMTGTLGMIMWLMMALMTAGMAGGAITWATQRPRRHTAHQHQLPDPAGTGASPAATSSPQPDDGGQRRAGSTTSGFTG